MACEEHLHITVGFSLKTDSELGLLRRFEQPTVIEAIIADFKTKTDSEWGLLCRFEQPTVIEAIIADFKTKTGSEGPCRHLLVKNIKKHYRFGACHRNLFVKNIKKFGPPEIQARVMGSRVRGLNR